MLRAAARDPDSVRAAVAGTVEPILARGRTELLDTLRAYLDADGNMNAAATRVFAHRHTVAHRLRAIRELTGLDPQTAAGKAELALGLKALVTRDALAALDGAPPRARLHAA
jgi:purine catabolism regulator